MPDTPPRCPDCDVETELMNMMSGSDVRFVSEKHREGILGTLGVHETYTAQAYVCPECGLSRVYADV